MRDEDELARLASRLRPAFGRGVLSRVAGRDRAQLHQPMVVWRNSDDLQTIWRLNNDSLLSFFAGIQEWIWHKDWCWVEQMWVIHGISSHAMHGVAKRKPCIGIMISFVLLPQSAEVSIHHGVVALYLCSSWSHYVYLDLPPNPFILSKKQPPYPAFYLNALFLSKTLNFQGIWSL